jgi:hypothetical protein
MGGCAICCWYTLAIRQEVCQTLVNEGIWFVVESGVPRLAMLWLVQPLPRRP